MSRRFERRRAVVTGASRGIGAAVALRLAAEGADLVLVARTLESHDDIAGSLRETQERIRKFGGTVGVIVADLTEDADRRRVVPEAVEILGGHVEILVNNAAVAVTLPLSTIPLARQHIQFEANVFAPLALSQAVIPGMRAVGEGWIVNLSSVGANLYPGPPFPPNPVGSTMDVYGATKAALNRISNGLAAELFGTGIRVNTVQPRIAVMSEGLAQFADKLPPGTLEPMEQIVEAVVALCDCPADHTGQIDVSLELLAKRGSPPPQAVRTS